MSTVHHQDHKLIPSLDGIRAVSVLIVLIGHSGYGNIVPGGLGVTIFFFLSGYLITTLMMAEHKRTGAINIKAFYARRIFRLLPPLLVTLMVAYGAAFAGLLDGGISLGGLLAQLFYFANYYGIYFHEGTVPQGTGILWSLAVEEHFYMLYPLIFSFLLARSWRLSTIGTFFALACVVILGWRLYLSHLPGFSAGRTYYASDTRIDSILYGCILATLKDQISNFSLTEKWTWPKWTIVTVAICTLLFTIVYRDETFRETFRYSIQGIALMPLFYFAVTFSRAWPFRYLNDPWAIKLGIYSYAIYLIHYILIGMMTKSAPWLALHPLIVFAAALSLSILYAAMIDRYVDSYFRNIRHKFRTAAKPAPVAMAID